MEKDERDSLQRRYGFSDGLMDKIAHGIDMLRKSERMALSFYDKGFYLAFSGGKDSQAIYHLAKLAGVRFQAHMNMTSVDPAEVVMFVKREYPDVERHAPDISFFDLIKKKGRLPSKQARYCCEHLKERGGGGTITVTGIRADESASRARRGEVGTTRKNHRKNMTFDQFSERMEEMVTCVGGKDKIVLSPILGWTEGDVWEFLGKLGVKHCGLYDRGYRRIGCVYCPMASQREMMEYPDQYPHYTKRFIDAISANCARRKEQADPYLIFLSYVTKRSLDETMGLIDRIRNGTFHPRHDNKEIWNRFIERHIKGKTNLLDGGQLTLFKNDDERDR